MNDTLKPVAPGTLVMIIHHAEYARIDGSGKQERANLCGTQGTVVVGEHDEWIPTGKMLPPAVRVRAYTIHLQSGELAIVERPYFVPIENPNQEQKEEEQETCDTLSA